MSALNAGLPNSGAKSSQLPICSIAQFPFRSYAPVTLPDGSVWIPSGTAVPMAQSPKIAALADNTAFRCVVPTAVTTPIGLNSGAGFEFYEGPNANSAFYISNTLAYVYTTDGGTSWSSATATGPAVSYTFKGSRVNGTNTEIYAHGNDGKLYRAVITQAAPQTCAFSAVYTFGDASYAAYGGFAYSAVDGKYLYCWNTATDNLLNSINSSDGSSWSANTSITATGASIANLNGVKVAAKPSGGFTVASSCTTGGTYVKFFGTTVGASYAAGSALNMQVSAIAYLRYFGSRLFFFAGNANCFYSDDNGASMANIYSLLIPQKYYQGTMYYSKPLIDASRITFFSWDYGNKVFINFSTDGNNFKSVPYFNGGDSISGLAYAATIGNRAFVPAGAGSLSRMFKTENVFTPNANTDYVGLPDFQNLGFSTVPNTLTNFLRIA